MTARLKIPYFQPCLLTLCYCYCDSASLYSLLTGQVSTCRIWLTNFDVSDIHWCFVPRLGRGTAGHRARICCWTVRRVGRGCEYWRGGLLRPFRLLVATLGSSPQPFGCLPYFGIFSLEWQTDMVFSEKERESSWNWNFRKIFIYLTCFQFFHPNKGMEQVAGWRPGRLGGQAPMLLSSSCMVCNV